MSIYTNPTKKPIAEVETMVTNSVKQCDTRHMKKNKTVVLIQQGSVILDTKHDKGDPQILDPCVGLCKIIAKEIHPLLHL